MTPNASAQCLRPGCGWSHAGTPAVVDRAATGHVAPGHGVLTSAVADGGRA